MCEGLKSVRACTCWSLSVRARNARERLSILFDASIVFHGMDLVAHKVVHKRATLVNAFPFFLTNRVAWYGFGCALSAWRGTVPYDKHRLIGDFSSL